MTGFIDLHCHILPEVDDGPSSVEQAVELVQGLEALGFTDFYPTPHQKPGSWMPSPEETGEAAHLLREALHRQGSGATVHDPAGENMWSARLLETEGTPFPAYPGGDAFLLEFAPYAVPSNLRNHFYEFRRSGKLPVVAHIERYPEITANEERLESIAAGGALLVNLSSLAGWWSSRDTRRLVLEGRIHAASTDAHGLADLDLCRRGLEWLRSKIGEEGIQRLLYDNPLQILSGQLPEP